MYIPLGTFCNFSIKEMIFIDLDLSIKLIEEKRFLNCFISNQLGVCDVTIPFCVLICGFYLQNKSWSSEWLQLC